ncbi:hypothetical protein [Spiroplasma endosymbiont of Apeira syringaria]|uniref:hypothetical protein n=1 Tax=Spiroplasma endosymbiont of Apeira syringaria TaxID=3066307 RepID=UPI0030D5C238
MWGEVRNFINQNSILEYLDIGEIIPNPPAQEFKHIKQIELKEVTAITNNKNKQHENKVDSILISKNDNSSYLNSGTTIEGEPILIEKKISRNIYTWKLVNVDSVVEWQPFLGLFFGRHLFLIINWS